MVKVAVWLARHDATAIDPGRKTTNTPSMTTAGVLIVRTASDAFLPADLATVTGRSEWTARRESDRRGTQQWTLMDASTELTGHDELSGHDGIEA